MKNHVIYLSIFMLVSLKMLAQTSNEGMLYISEDTQFSTVERFNNLSTGTFYNDGDVFIYSHFNNDGILDFYQNTGLTRFIGMASQMITGSKVSYLYNVYFNNVSNAIPFQVSGDIDISGKADLSEGIVDNDNHGGEITFNTNATHVNTSDDSHVDGPVNKIGTTDFVFPIGDGGYYRFGGIIAPTHSNTIFEGKFYFKNSNDLYSHQLKAGGIEEIDNQEYWTIKKMSTPQEDVLITLSWRDVTTPQSIINAAENDAVVIVRWDVATNMWVNEGGAIDLDSKTVTTAVSGYGFFTLARVKADVALPGNLIVYNGVTPNGDGKNDYFIIDIPNDGTVRDVHVQVYNRWGVKVFETNNYGQNGNVFDGFSNGRMTIDNSQQLPSGTYYYILDYEYGTPVDKNRHKQAGYLYLSGN